MRQINNNNDDKKYKNHCYLLEKETEKKILDFDSLVFV